MVEKKEFTINLFENEYDRCLQMISDCDQEIINMDEWLKLLKKLGSRESLSLILNSPSNQGYNLETKSPIQFEIILITYLARYEKGDSKHAIDGKNTRHSIRDCLKTGQNCRKISFTQYARIFLLNKEAKFNAKTQKRY